MEPRTTNTTGGKLFLYAGLVIPVLLAVSMQQSYERTGLSTLEWVVYVILLAWFILGVLTLMIDLDTLVARYRRPPQEGLLRDLLQHLPADPAPAIPPGVAALTAPAVQPAQGRPTPAPATPAEEASPAEETSPAEEVPQDTATPAHEPIAPAPVATAFTTLPDRTISSSGNSATLARATDPSFPWPAPFDLAVLDEIAARGRERGYIPFYLGVTRWRADGSALEGGRIAPLVRKVYPGSACSTLIAGITDSGKSVLLNTMMISAAYAASPADLALAIVDLDAGGANFQTVAKLPHVQRIVTKPREAFLLAQEITREHARRAQLFVAATAKASTQVDDIGAYNAYARQAGIAPLPIHIVVIDELRTFIQACRALDSAKTDFAPAFIEHMAYAMRKTGIGPIFATQYPLKEVLPRTASTQIEVIVSMRLKDTIQTRVIFGDATLPYLPEHLPAVDPDPKNKRYAGRCVIALNGQYYLAQAATIPDREGLVATIAGRAVKAAAPATGIPVMTFNAPPPLVVE